jgi:uncharacterized membrane protein YfcA
MKFILLGIFLAAVTLFNIIVPAFGSTTVTPIMAGFVGAKDAIAVATVFYCISNIPRVYLFRKYTDWNLVKRLWPASIIGALLGSIFLVGISAFLVTIILLSFLAFFIYKKAVSMFANKPKNEKQPTKQGATFIGLLSGALQGTGLSGADLRNGYLYSKGLTIQHIHGTTAWIGMTNFAFASGVRVVSGDLTLAMAWPVLALFPVIVLATIAGRHLALKIPKRVQDYIILAIMLVALVVLASSFFRQ